MKKSTLIIIGVVYIASIVLISVLGLVPKVYRPVYPVTKIECLNETDDKVRVYNRASDGKLIVRLKFEEPAAEDGSSGTLVQLIFRVTPDNATNPNLHYQYKNSTRIKFVQDGAGRETGILLFFGPSQVDLTVVAADGSGVKLNLLIWAEA